MPIKHSFFCGVFMTTLLLPCISSGLSSNALDALVHPAQFSVCPKPTLKSLKSLQSLQDMIRRESAGTSLNIAVINVALNVLKCTSDARQDYAPILTIIDYSRPTSKKRLWVFDLDEGKLLYHTYVSHGINSGTTFTTFFSNRYNSKATSIGVYRTDGAYYGRDGLSLKLTGLENGFNEQAERRAIVMHGGWYVDEAFIKKYGRAGRSWGCPALPLNQASSIINTIKNHSILIAYYPNDDWFLSSNYLRCGQKIERHATSELKKPDVDVRDDVFFADLPHTAHRHDDTQSIVAMSADRYVELFKTKAPLTRMLRRQVDNVESIALNEQELMAVMNHVDSTALQSIYFVQPILKMVRGYYLTEMHRVDLGLITSITNNGVPDDGSSVKRYTVHFEHAPAIQLSATHQFIRWLGL